MSVLFDNWFIVIFTAIILFRIFHYLKNRFFLRNHLVHFLKDHDFEDVEEKLVIKRFKFEEFKLARPKHHKIFIDPKYGKMNGYEICIYKQPAPFQGYYRVFAASTVILIKPSYSMSRLLIFPSFKYKSMLNLIEADKTLMKYSIKKKRLIGFSSSNIDFEKYVDKEIFYYPLFIESNQYSLRLFSEGMETYSYKEMEEYVLQGISICKELSNKE